MPSPDDKADARIESEQLYESAYAAYEANRESEAAATLSALLDACPPEFGCPLRGESVTLLATMLAEPPWDGASPGDEGLARFDAVVGRSRAWSRPVLEEMATWLSQSHVHDRAAPAWIALIELDPCGESRSDWVESLAIALELSGDLDGADDVRAERGMPACPSP